MKIAILLPFKDTYTKNKAGINLGKDFIKNQNIEKNTYLWLY